MDTPLVIDNEDALRLASALAALTGESLTAAIVAALGERLEREQAVRHREAERRLSRAIAANVRQEAGHLARVPDHGWCRVADSVVR
jgi:antitoxin VapB